MARVEIWTAFGLPFDGFVALRHKKINKTRLNGKLRMKPFAVCRFIGF
ncbi:MAG: hypothetical protein LBF86_03690 [Helicobacteraceae bacterium]|nr:hypothetical protein [Helicobacteraceae bacterium]